MDTSNPQQITDAVSRATGLALQADSAAAVDLLSQLPAHIDDADAAGFREAMIARFGPDSTPTPDLDVDDSWIADLAQTFVTYWHRVLTKRQPQADAEAELVNTVTGMLQQPLAADATIDDLERAAQTEFSERGYYGLMGRTRPLRELMLWRSQTVAEVEVRLPEGAYPMTVTYLEDFVIRGWCHYATCGRRSSAGWATAAGLFAVVPAYKRIDGETFTVRFLAHEAQHSMDLQTFGTLDGWELEYRAKLTEVALSVAIQSETLKLLCENRSDATKESPHAYANFLVIRDLEQRLADQPDTFDLCRDIIPDAQAVRDAAAALLLADTQSRAGNTP